MSEFETETEAEAAERQAKMGALCSAYLDAYDAHKVQKEETERLSKIKTKAQDALLAVMRKGDAIRLSGRLVSPSSKLSAKFKPEAYDPETAPDFFEALQAAGIPVRPNGQTLAAMYKSDWEEGAAVPKALALYLETSERRSLSVRNS